MTPHTLADWTKDAVVDLLTRRLFESDSYDNKQQLPHPSDDGAMDRLRRTCCAFANSDGGFIVFGIDDDRTKEPEDRLIGLPADLGFPEHFGNYPRNCHPSIEWNFANPPISLDSGNVLHIVEIPKSWKAPHASGDRDGGWCFTKRTNKGNEGITIDEVRTAFLGLYEKRLQLLQAELKALQENASAAIVTGEGSEEKYSLLSFDVRIIESILADTYSITASDAELQQALSKIRQTATVANNKIQIFFSIVAMPMSNKKELVREHNEFMVPKCQQLAEQCTQAMERLNLLLG